MPFLAIVFAAGTCRLCGGWRRVVFNAGFEAGFEAGLEAGLEAAFEAVCRARLEACSKPYLKPCSTLCPNP
jgi:hypothetical protein